MKEIVEIISKIDSTVTNETMAELESAFSEIQQPRSSFELENFVIKQHDTDPRQYAQCVLELQIKYNNIRRGIINKKKLEFERDNLLKKKDVISKLDAELKSIDIEEQDYAMMGALREFQSLYGMFKSFPIRYTRKDMEEDSPEYWNKRLTRQANMDLLSVGRVSQGNIDALRMIGKSPVPELDAVRDLERKALEQGDTKLLIVVPSEHKLETLPTTEGLEIPSGIQVKYYNVYGRKIDEAYNDAALEALRDGADYMLCVEDDTFPPHDAIFKLMEHMKAGKDYVGAWYPKRQKVREGTSIYINSLGKREAIPDDGNVHECFALATGCAMIATNVFLKLQYPYFVTTAHLTQDTFFTQKLKEIGIKSYCDTSIKCKHVDRVSGEVFE